jgi:hypothetical protein
MKRRLTTPVRRRKRRTALRSGFASKKGGLAIGGREISTVNPGAHITRSSSDARPLDAGYNVQTAAASKHKLIVNKDIASRKQSGTACYIPKIDNQAHAPDRDYDKRHFRYDADFSATQEDY